MKGVNPNMKRSHEYDSPVLSRIVSVVTVFAICICSVCTSLCCYKMSSMTVATVAQTTSSSGGSGSGSDDGSGSGSETPVETTAAPAGEDTSGTATNGETTTAAGGTSAAGTTAAASASNAEILAKYTSVMNNLKSKVSTYTKKEFQDLPSDKLDLGSASNIILPIAKGFMTTEDKAEEQARNDASNIPILGTKLGCMLTDTSAIKSAKMTTSGDKTTIVLVLKDEKNSQPADDNATTAPSKVGSVFSPLRKSDIDNTLAGIKAVTVNSFDLTYQDCTATLVFNTKTNQVESLTQVMNCYIEANVKVVIATISGHAVLVNTMKIYNIKYK